MVIWAPKSILDLREAWDFIAADSETAADRIISTLQRAGESLDQFPKLGRAGRVSHTRELVVSGTAYFLVYYIRRDHVEIARVIHGARQWPTSRKRT
ncbi:MAG TPA: type II toxin-antitoxin system RelE/ParE family toxin [Rhizomicrobium sp.]|nr:type II toxin-antitoxin system RelE/ParE family toxin [Rhizomicrobium sp.]